MPALLDREQHLNQQPVIGQGVLNTADVLSEAQNILAEVKSAGNNLKIDQKEALFGQPMQVPLASPLDQRILRQEIMQAGVINRIIVVGMPKPESERTGKYIERPMDEKKPWSAFGQLILTKEHINPETGEITKTWVGFSISLPGGVGERMTKKMLGRTVGLQRSDFESWDGVEEGQVFAAHKAVPDALKLLNLFDRLVDMAEIVIKEDHADDKHKVVQHFMNLQQARRAGLDKAKEIAAEALVNPEFKGMSAYQEELDGTGFYLIGGVIKNGIWFGPNTRGELVPVTSVITDDPHLNSVKYIEKSQVETEGDSVSVDGDSSECVTFCGGAEDGDKRGCSEIFAEREGYLFNDRKSINVDNVLKLKNALKAITNGSSEYSEVMGISGSIRSSESSTICNICSKDKFAENGCKCHSEKSKAA